METIRKSNGNEWKQKVLSRSDNLYQKACQRALNQLASSGHKFEKTDCFPMVEHFLQQIEARTLIMNLQKSINGSLI